MQIEFINHAGFILRVSGVAVCTDPWLSGTAFDGSWSLCTPTVMTPRDFDSVDFICFSHTHPDHFSLGTLSTIPPRTRSNINILYRNDASEEIAAACLELGFKSVQALTQRPTEVARHLRIASAEFRGGDAWIRYETEEANILNTNDCVIADVADAAKIGRWNPTVDILMTKFSYSSWAGNPEESLFRKALARDRLQAIALQASHFRPRTIIPIGNHSYFCHNENYYLNDEMNSPADACEFIERDLKIACALLYPGDNFRFGEKWDSYPRIAKFRREYDAIKALRFAAVNSPSKSTAEISDEHAFYRAEHRPIWVQRKLERQVGCTVHVTDLGVSVQLFEDQALRVVSATYAECDLAMASDCLSCCITKRYGFEDVRMGGRLRQPLSGGLRRCAQYFLGHPVDFE